jgi:hypothetical protein
MFVTSTNIAQLNAMRALACHPRPSHRRFGLGLFDDFNSNCGVFDRGSGVYAVSMSGVNALALGRLDTGPEEPGLEFSSKCSVSFDPSCW